MSCIACPRPLTGVLDRVMVVVLLGSAGLTAGLVYGTLVSSGESFSHSCRTGSGPQPWCSPTTDSKSSLGVTVVMPAKSSYSRPVHFRSARDTVRLFRRDHPGVREVAHGERVIEVTAAGLSPSARWQVCMIARRHCDDYTAHWLAMRQVVQRTLLGSGGRSYEVIWRGAPPTGFSSAAMSGRLPIGGNVLFGLLAGLSTALGFLVPPRSRVTAPR
jgi:hypothetical protein